MRSLLALILISVSAFVFYSFQGADLFDLPGLSPKASDSAQKTKDIHALRSEAANLACQQIEAEFEQSGLSWHFHTVLINARDERLKELTFLKELYTCFEQDEMGTLILEIEAFTSDFAQEKGSDLQLQFSVFDYVSQNKLSEFGFVFELGPQDSKEPLQVKGLKN